MGVHKTGARSLRYTNEATTYLRTKGYQAVANGNTLTVTRLPGTQAPAGAPSLPPPVLLENWSHVPAGPGVSFVFHPGDEFALRGANFTPGSRVVLELGVCPTVDLQVLSVTPDGTGIHFRVPSTLSSQLFENWSILTVVTPSGASNGINGIFQPDMADVTTGTIYVTSWMLNSHSIAHASNDGGLGFVEGTSMITTEGADRTSCCDDNFFMYNDGFGSDRFGKGVTLLNGYMVVSVDIVPTCKDGSHGSPDTLKPCAAFLTPSPFFMWANLGKTNASFETDVSWFYQGGSSVEYTLTYKLWGPAQMRPLSTFPKVGVRSCEK